MSLNIVVLVKQVPDTSEVRMDPVRGTLIREGVPSIINPFDVFAIEAGLALRDAHGGKVTLLSMGPPQAGTALREGISMGADDAILISDRAFAGSDTLATSYALATAVRKIGQAAGGAGGVTSAGGNGSAGGVDLILAGRQAIDGDTAQVGPGVAEQLGLPSITCVSKIEGLVAANGTGPSLRLRRMLEDGYQLVEVGLPCVLTVVKDINKPRLPSLRGMMKSKSYNLPTWSAADIAADTTMCGLAGSATRVKRIFSPEKRSRGEILEGGAAEQAKALVQRLRDSGFSI